MASTLEVTSSIKITLAPDKSDLAKTILWFSLAYNLSPNKPLPHHIDAQAT